MPTLLEKGITLIFYVLSVCVCVYRLFIYLFQSFSYPSTCLPTIKTTVNINFSDLHTSFCTLCNLKKKKRIFHFLPRLYYFFPFCLSFIIFTCFSLTFLVLLHSLNFLSLSSLQFFFFFAFTAAFLFSS